MMKEKNRLIYNGIDFSKFGTVEDVQITFLSTSNALGELPARTGTLFRKQKINGKKIDVNIRLIEKSRSDTIKMSEDLKKVILSEKPEKLHTSKYKDSHFMAVIDGDIDLEQRFNKGFLKLTFISPDGVRYADAPTNGTDNHGNIPNFWELEGMINSDAVKIIKKDTLEKIQIDATRLTGQKIKIDSEDETVYINNRLTMERLYLDSDFFKFEVGANNIKVEGLSRYSFTSRARWI